MEISDGGGHARDVSDDLHARWAPAPARARRHHPEDRKSTRLNSSHSSIYTLSLHDALPILSPSTAGLLTTASGLIFTGDADGNLLALDSHDGKLLWRYQMGAAMHGTSPTTYMLDGRQHLLVPAGTTLKIGRAHV